MKGIIVIITFVFFISCGDCGNDLNIGNFLLLNESKNYFLYENNSVLTFIDQNDVEHVLTVLNKRELINSRLIVRTICDAGIFDKQHLYFKIQREQISFEENKRQVFYIDLTTYFEDNEKIDSIGVFDKLYIGGNLPVEDAFKGVNCNIITGIHQNTISEDFRRNFINEAKYLGDTLLQGTSYKGVFQGRPDSKSAIYYSKTDGVVLLYIDDDNYWKLKK